MTLFKRIFSALAALAFALTLGVALAQSPADYDMNNPQNLLPEHLYAESALLVDEDSGEVLFSKNAKIRMFPASTTKIMTLLLALESDVPLDSRVTIPAEAAQIPEGSSVIPVRPGDEMSFSDLLYGFMLSSGNDGANAIAVLVDGGIPAFVERMNRRAAELGCQGTHYVNVHGYHDAEHYTTAEDLVRLSRFAMQNETFRKIVAAPTWTMSIRRGGEETRQEIISRNSLLQSGEKYYYPACTGIKTGHHSKAGWCFVGSAERDGMRLICAVLNCEKENDKWYDAARLFEYGFTRYQDVDTGELFAQAWERYSRASVEGAAPDDPQGGELTLNLEQVEGGSRSVKLVSGSETARADAVEKLAQGIQIEWQRELAAPIEQGETLGRMRASLPDGAQLTATLTASRTVSAQPVATATAAPVETAVPQAQTAPPVSEPPKTGGVGTGMILLAIAALLVLGCAVAALMLRSARERKRRRRRRTRRPSASARPKAPTRPSAAGRPNAPRRR